MAIGAFGIDPASKFATELQSLEIWRKPYRGDRAPPTVFHTVIRYRERAAIRSGSAGLDFQKGSLRFRFLVVSFHTVQAGDPRIYITSLQEDFG